MKLDFMWTLINNRINTIANRVTELEAKETALTVDALTSVTYAQATATTPSDNAIRYITDALREGGGVGTVAYYDPITQDWLRVSDNSVVTT